MAGNSSQGEISVYRGGRERSDEVGGTNGLQPPSTSRRWWKRRPASQGKNGRSAIGAMLGPFKAAVSNQKQRFMEDGFDLDLAYVTKRIIIHGVSNESSDPFYQDPRTEVRRLLDKYHANRYKVYNFASELVHVNPSDGVLAADSRTERYPFTDDHPPLESVVDFCENAKAWLDAHEDNVVSLHCKAGKARAGIMAACLMVRMGETAQDAVASYDATQGPDLKARPGMNQRAWVFLYERLIREVWGLRDTIGTVSGQNPSLRAPPKFASCIRDVSLQLELPARRKRWNAILYHPSCAIYQQRPGGKALVHRAKMPSVHVKRKGSEVSTFAATLPRSVIVEGTFQVVVSAATGMFSLAKNVLDVWCNTTFLGEDGGREAFKFTENDLPPGPLTQRLLAANVCVVLTHTHPDAASPARRGTLVEWKGLDHGRGASGSGGGDALRLMERVEPSATPDTDLDTSDMVTELNGEGDDGRDRDAAATRAAVEAAARALRGERPEQLDSDEGAGRRYYLSSDDESAAGSPVGPHEPLQIKVMDSQRSSAEPAPWNPNVPGSRSAWSGFNTPAARSGFTTPRSGACPSPLRSCPRAAVSARKERLNERVGEMMDGAPPDKDAVSIPRWASSKAYPTPTNTIDFPARGGRGSTTPARALATRADKRSRAGTPLRNAENNASVAPAESTRGSGGGGGGGGGAGKGPGWQDARVIPTAMATPSSGRANGRGGLRLDKFAYLADPANAEQRATPQRASPGNERGKEEQGTTTARPATVAAAAAAASSITSKGTLSSMDSMKMLLETAARMSFEDLQSSRHTSVAGSDTTDRSEIISRAGSFSDGDGERASLTARVLAGWVESGINSRPLLDLPRVAGLADDDAVKAERIGSPVDRPMTARSEVLKAITPASDRKWPARVVAGEMEIQGALMAGGDGDGKELVPSHQGRHSRKHGSCGASWGEHAKLALARKRLEWEKTRRVSNPTSYSLRMHASLVAKREAELLAIETDVKQAVRVLEERIARRESAQAALKEWRRELPPKAYEDVMGCLQGNQAFGLYGST